MKNGHVNDSQTSEYLGKMAEEVEAVSERKRTKYKRFLSHSSPYSAAPRRSRKTLIGKRLNQSEQISCSAEIPGEFLEGFINCFADRCNL